MKNQFFQITLEVIIRYAEYFWDVYNGVTSRNPPGPSCKRETSLSLKPQSTAPPVRKGFNQKIEVGKGNENTKIVIWGISVFGYSPQTRFFWRYLSGRGKCYFPLPFAISGLKLNARSRKSTVIHPNACSFTGHQNTTTSSFCTTESHEIEGPPTAFEAPPTAGQPGAGIVSRGPTHISESECREPFHAVLNKDVYPREE